MHWTQLIFCFSIVFQAALFFASPGAFAATCESLFKGIRSSLSANDESNVDLLSRISGPSLTRHQIQNLLSGAIFKLGRKPVLLVGESASGKSLHLNVMTQILDRNGTDYLYFREGRKLNDSAATENVEMLSSALAQSTPGLVRQNSLGRQETFWSLEELGVQKRESFNGYYIMRQQALAAKVFALLDLESTLGQIVVVDHGVVTSERLLDSSLPSTADIMAKLVQRQLAGAAGSAIAVSTSYYRKHIVGSDLETKFEIVEFP